MATLAAVFWNLLGLGLMVVAVVGAVTVWFFAASARVRLTARERKIGYSACVVLAGIGLLLIVFK